MDYVYYAKIALDPDGEYDVEFPDVPEVVTGAKTKEEAYSNAREALGLALRGYLDMGRALPIPKKYRGLTPVPVDTADALKLAVIETFNASNITKTELANRLGKQEGEARRILDPDHPTKLQALEQALAVLGKQVVVTVKDAA